MIFPCYNGERWLRNAIESVLEQSYRDFELVIIDDGSTDNTPNIISSYASHKRVHCIFQENRGFSAANNRGIIESEGSFVGFIGQDDLWLPHKLQEQMDYQKKHEDVDLIHSNLYHINSNGIVTRKRNPKIPDFLSTRELIEYLFFRNFICFQTAIVRRECFQDVGLFDERMVAFSDHDLWLRIANKFKFGYIDRPLVKKRYHQNQLMKTGKESAIRDEFLIAQKAVNRYPFLAELKRKRFSKLYLSLGLTLLEKGDKAKAKNQFIKSMRCHLFHPQSILGSLVPSFYLFVRKGLFKLRNLFRRSPNILSVQPLEGFFSHVISI